MNNVLKKLRLRRRTLKPKKFQPKWKDVQKMLSNKDQWADAIIAADALNRAGAHIDFNAASRICIFGAVVAAVAHDDVVVTTAKEAFDEFVAATF